MKSFINSLAVTIVFITTVSFTNATYDFIGTYGVYENDPSNIKLTIDENHTYSYQDFSDPKNKINITGNWELKGNTVELKTNNIQYTFHNKWKFSKNGQIAKSRKGLTYYTLCKLNK